jgi:hexokinase
MIPTWVFGWPSGKEKGSYLAVDLGGTNLRVCEVELEGEGKFAITQSKYRLTDEQKLGDGQALCRSRWARLKLSQGTADHRYCAVDFCAECLASFIKDHYENEDGSVILDKDIALGFTFSYPCL